MNDLLILGKLWSLGGNYCEATVVPDGTPRDLSQIDQNADLVFCDDSD